MIIFIYNRAFYISLMDYWNEKLIYLKKNNRKFIFLLQYLLLESIEILDAGGFMDNVSQSIAVGGCPWLFLF